MNELFELIINKLQAKDSINMITEYLRQSIKNGNITTSEVFLLFFEFLKEKYRNENNDETFMLMDRYLRSEISLQQLSQSIFFNKIDVDYDKRDGHTPQFVHSFSETFLDEIFRVLYEFTRGDLDQPIGVCYDFCLFVAGLAIAKGEERTIYLWNSIEKKSGENNYILFFGEGKNVTVYDIYNQVYLPLEKYDNTDVGFCLIPLHNDTLLKNSRDLTGFNHEAISYKQVESFFQPQKKETDSSNLETFPKLPKTEEDTSDLETFPKLPKTEEDTSDLETLREQTYYQRLGIKNDATAEEIKQSFKQVITKYHPDTHPDDIDATEKTKLIVEAYACLRNEAFRKAYDLKLAQPVKDNNTNKQSSTGNQSVTEDIDFDEYFEEFIHEFMRRYKAKVANNYPIEKGKKLNQDLFNNSYQTEQNNDFIFDYRINQNFDEVDHSRLRPF